MSICDLKSITLFNFYLLKICKICQIQKSAVAYTCVLILVLVYSIVYMGSAIGFAFSTSVAGLIVTRIIQALGSSLSVVSGLALLAITFR